MAIAEDSQCSAASVQRIMEAVRFAAEKHAQQKRKGVLGEPYINHLIEVADLIAASSNELDTNLIIAGLLHDTVEDVGVTFQELENHFGSDVARLVAEVTDDKSLPKVMRKQLQVETAHKKSQRAQTLKLADKIANLRSILTSPPTHWDLERKQQYFEWARQVISGIQKPNPYLKAEFEKTYKLVSQLKETKTT